MRNKNAEIMDTALAYSGALPLYSFPCFTPFLSHAVSDKDSRRGLFEVIYATGFMEWEALSSTGQVKMLLLLAQGHCKTY